MAKTRSKTGQQIGKDRRQEILAAAAQVITDRGLAETRIQDIAETCGVSTGLILYYFESKDRLLVEALTYANDQFYLRLSRELRKNPSARAQLDRLIELSIPGLLPEFSFLDEWSLWVEIWVRATRLFDLSGAAVLAALQLLAVVAALTLHARMSRRAGGNDARYSEGVIPWTRRKLVVNVPTLVSPTS